MLFYLALLVATMLRPTDAPHDDAIFVYAQKRHTMTTRDLMLNSLGTVSALIARVYYRKWKKGAHPGGGNESPAKSRRCGKKCEANRVH